MIRFAYLCFLAWIGGGYTQGNYLSQGYYYPVDGLFSQKQYQTLREIEDFQRWQYERELAARQQIVYEDELRIPGEKPTTNDSYLCTAFKQPKEKSIISFEPLDSSHAAHHIILFVCEQPGINHPVPAWDCSEMADTQTARPSSFIKGPPCKLASAPIYAWSHNAGAEKTELPKGVGFPIGGMSKNQFIVLQVHYMNALEQSDFSGVKIGYTNTIQPKTAATLLLVTGGSLSPKTRENFEAACVVDEDIEIHPISFRVHTHRHGEKVSGWVVKEDETGTDSWSLLGERSPQKAQIFQPVKNNSMVIGKGDVLASKCTIYNNENHLIEMGPTSEDEMCNFYLMYWSEGQALSDNVCYSPGAPKYRWSREAGLNHIPN